MQALTEYSYQARLRDITDMNVVIEATGEEGRASNKVFISNSNVSSMNIIPVSHIQQTICIVVVTSHVKLTHCMCLLPWRFNSYILLKGVNAVDSG